jgi:hypothetical protein
VLFLFYVDEAGTASYTQSTIEKHPLFLLVAVGVHEANWRALEDAAREVKRKFFPRLTPEQVELKGRDLQSALAGKAPKGSPLQNLTLEQARLFAAGVFGLFQPDLVTLFAVGVDQQAMKRRYTEPWPTYSVAYAILCQLLTRYLASSDSPQQGLLLLDRNSQAERRITDLQQVAQRLSEGAPTPVRLDLIIERPLFVESRRHHGIQLADLFAHTIDRFLTRVEGVERFFDAVKHCLARGRTTGTIYGTGFQGVPEYMDPPWVLSGRLVPSWEPLRRQ